jgi:PQQ-dependent catabolism-associated beta-propeller protein
LHPARRAPERPFRVGVSDRRLRLAVQEASMPSRRFGDYPVVFCAQIVANLRKRSTLHILLSAGAMAAVLAAAPSGGFAKDTGLIFVSSEKTNNVVVIDPETNKVIKHLKTSRRPLDMHFSADHGKLYIACSDDGAIDIVDVAELKVIGRINTAARPETFAIDEKRRRIYVSNKEGASLSVIDMEQNIILHEVPTGAEPEEVFVSEDGTNVYTISEIGDLVHSIDAEGGYVMQDVVVGARPRRLAATPDRRELWVSTELSGEIHIISRATFSVDGRVRFLPLGIRKTDVTPSDLLITENGQTAYVALGNAALVAVVDVRTRKIRDYIPAGKRAGALAMTRDENTLYVADIFSDAITVIDVAAKKEIASIPVDRSPRAILIDD